MSYTYRLHGSRYLRKYTAAERSSIYSYMTDVRTIANSLCTVPWTRVGRDIPATITIHTEEGIDWNAPERDRFDAAEWCGEHSDGFHRAFAQAACYVFKLPTSAIGTDIEKIRVNVTSDPYNPYGARIAAMTSATLDIPMDCATVRTGEMHRAPDEDGLGAAPRLFMRNADGTQTWYGNTEIVELAPGDGSTVTAKQYLFVFVCLENYNRGREGWIEGSSYIDNDVELTLSSACEDLDDLELNDLSRVVTPVEYPIVSGGVVPDVQGESSGVVSVTVMSDGTTPVLDDNGRCININQIADCLAPTNIHAGVSSLYGHFNAGDLKVGNLSSVSANRKRLGCGFSVRQSSDVTYVNQDGLTESPKTLTISASSLLVPFAIPNDIIYNGIALDWSSWLSTHTPSTGSRFNVWIKVGSFVTDYPSQILTNHSLYDASEDNVDGWQRLATIDASIGTSGVIGINFGKAKVATALLTAYIDSSNIEHTNDDFTIGLSNFWFDAVSLEHLIQDDPDLYNEMTYVPGSNYNVGEIKYIENFSQALTNVQISSPCIFKVGDRFIAFNSSYNRPPIYSEDGTNWTVSSITDSETNGISVYDNHEKHIIIENNLIVVCSFYGMFYSIDSGSSFSRCTLEGEPIEGLFSIAGSLNSGFVAARLSSSKPYLHSTDGIVWTDITSTMPAGVDILSLANGCFFACTRTDPTSRLYRSTDLQTWDNILTASNAQGLFVYFTGRYYVGYDQNNSGIWFSNDGISWSRSNQTSGRFTSPVTDGNGFCILLNAYPNTYNLIYSEDGSTWNRIELPGKVIGVTYENGRWFAYCFAYDQGTYVSYLYVSVDGKNWVLSKSFSDSYVADTVGDCICVKGEVFLMSRASGFIYECPIATLKCISPVLSAQETVDLSKWYVTYIPGTVLNLKSRVHNRLSLCIPDITLIG